MNYLPTDAMATADLYTREVKRRKELESEVKELQAKLDKVHEVYLYMMQTVPMRWAPIMIVEKLEAVFEPEKSCDECGHSRYDSGAKHRCAGASNW